VQSFVHKPSATVNPHFLSGHVRQLPRSFVHFEPAQVVGQVVAHAAPPVVPSQYFGSPHISTSHLLSEPFVNAPLVPCQLVRHGVVAQTPVFSLHSYPGQPIEQSVSQAKVLVAVSKVPYFFAIHPVVHFPVTGSHFPSLQVGHCYWH
jgi:hypothetical protein